MRLTGATDLADLADGYWWRHGQPMGKKGLYYPGASYCAGGYGAVEKPGGYGAVAAAAVESPCVAGPRP